MKDTKLNDVLELIIDYRGKTPKKLGGDWSEQGYRAISAKNVKNGLIVNEQDMRRVDHELYQKWMKDELREADILLTSEAPFGESLYWDYGEKMVLSQRLFALRPDNRKIYPKYLYAFIRSDLFFKKMMQKQSGTTVFGIRQSQLRNIKIDVPSKEIQEFVGDVNYKFEKLIQENLNQIKGLEQYAQLIFYKWFVDFNFPNKDNEPYRDSGGEFVEKNGKKVPINWDYKKLGHFIELINGLSYTSDEIEGENGLEFISLSSFQRNGGYKKDGIKFYSGSYNDEDLVYPGNLCVAATDLTKNSEIIGSPLLVPKLKTNRFLISCDVVKINLLNDSLSKGFINNLLKQSHYRRYIKGFTSGTNVLHLDKKGLLRYKTVVPEKEILEKFNLISKSIEDKISFLMNEIELLQEFRELFLKKMIG